MKKRIVILGGGFGGAYTAMHLQKFLNKQDDFEITLVNRENYFVFQPMLAEVVGGSLGLLDTINPLRKLLPKTALYVREIEAIDIEGKKIFLAPKFTHKSVELPYDHLVLALGNVTDFKGMSGLHEHALPFKNLADAITIRNQVIDVIEAASSEKDPYLRRQLLTFVVGGGGFSGTEVVAEVNDFVRKMAKQYNSIDSNEIKVVLAHSKDRLMERELSASLGEYAGKLLKRRGVDIRFNVHLIAATPEEAVLDSGERIASKTIISTVPSSPNPLIEGLPLKTVKGKIIADATMLAEGRDDVWSLGDCAAVPNLEAGGICPPTAQFAIRQAKVLAHNIVASIRNKQNKEFRFKALGMMGALGHHSAVAELFGKFKFSGLIAWFMWRMIYWAKLPGLDRKIKVALSWILDTIVPIEAVQMKAAPSQGMAQLHFESGEIIFNEGDVGDYLYIIVDGEVEVFNTIEGKENLIGKLGKGEYFGEMALLNQRSRLATVRCLTSVDVLALRKSDFGILISNFAELRQNFEQTDKERRQHIQ
ncbi:FAD-dependent oxidoreductase [Simkania sp.]|uniref:FAD-dependent oxidoreductase n=1 Tax=Simkania sp. TaxID=34094 RepID=UPI003B51DFDA